MKVVVILTKGKNKRLTTDRTLRHPEVDERVRAAFIAAARRCRHPGLIVTGGRAAISA